VLLHGLGATARLTWGECYAALGTHFRVIALDHRGHGKGLRTRRFRLEDCADDAVLAAGALGIERALLVGYSLGGPIALLGWRRHRACVAGVVLAATAARFGDSRRARIARLLEPAARLLAHVRPDHTRELLLRRALFRLERPEHAPWIEAELAGHHVPTLLGAARAAWRFSCDAWIGDIDVPVSVVVTTDDDRIAPARQRALARAVPAARIWEVPGRHTACLTQADVFAPALAEACADAWHRAEGGSGR
jgi:3-oxoadipate enol-lactonase